MKLQRFFALFTIHRANGPQPTPQSEGGVWEPRPQNRPRGQVWGHPCCSAQVRACGVLPNLLTEAT